MRRFTPNVGLNSGIYELHISHLAFSGEVVDVTGVDVEPHGVDVGEAVADEVAHEAVTRHVLHLDERVDLEKGRRARFPGLPNPKFLTCDSLSVSPNLLSTSM